MLRVGENLHCIFGFIKTKERIWILLLEGIFELIFFHEDVHEENMKRRSLLRIRLQSRREEEFKHENLFWILLFILCLN